MAGLADWLVRQAPAWLRGERGPLGPAPRRALIAIARCRSPALGGRVYRCTSCQKHDYAYHSCHHRACPRCGGGDTAAWTQAREEELLPVSHFFWTFTVPDKLRPAFAARPAELADLLFRSAFGALQSVANQQRHLGARLGALGVLHTWGRQLQHHPHVHFIVPGGGLRPDGKRWRMARNPEWFLPVRAVAAAFRIAFAEGLATLVPGFYTSLPATLWRQPWNVDVQAAGQGPAVLRYLARYVKRTAISNERILHADDRSVTFCYTDSQTGQRKELTLGADEFMRRYLRHVPPAGQHRVRYFGWWHPSAWRRRLRIETLLQKRIVVRVRQAPEPDWSRCCPACRRFTLILIAELPRGPP